MGRFLCLGVAALFWTSAPQQTTFRTRVETVAVYATVSDDEGRLVPDLSASDFEIYDNRSRVGIDFFSADPQPITVAVMLDMSGSMERRFLRVRESTEHFVDALGPADRAQIGSFGWEIAISPLLTSDKQVLKRVINEELWPGGGTPLWNAVDVAMTALAGERGRRVVLVLTDGRDTGDLKGWQTSAGRVEDHAREAGFMVYAIGMEGPGLDSGIRRLAEDTGGGYFELQSDADLSATFARVAAELRHQYVLGFTPAALDGKTHRLADGRASGNRLGLAEAAEHAIAAGVSVNVVSPFGMIYIPQTPTMAAVVRPNVPLSQFAAATGGLFIGRVPGVGSHPDRVLTTILPHMRHSCAVRFTPPMGDDQFHRLDVRVTRPGAGVTAARGFVAYRVR